jgi:hypothetical protein
MIDPSWSGSYCRAVPIPFRFTGKVAVLRDCAGKAASRTVTRRVSASNGSFRRS